MPTYSYAHGASSEPLLGETIGKNLYNTCQRFPDREALVSVYQGYRATYAQLWQQVTAVAKALLTSGVQPGERVALWAPNCYEWVLVQYATARIGAILVNINPAYRTSELAYVLRQSGFVNIVGWLKDMILRGGENGYPREVEEFLYTHEAVEEVQIIGVPSAKFGEEVVGWVKIKSGHAVTSANLEQVCRHQIAHYKIPRHWKFVRAFPMAVTGKCASWPWQS